MDPRLRSAFTAYAFGVLGVFLVFAPWSALYRNILMWAEADPAIGGVLASGWFRGLVSGIGLIDVWVAAREARRAARAGDPASADERSGGAADPTGAGPTGPTPGAGA